MESQALARVPGEPWQRLTPEEANEARRIARAFDARDAAAVGAFGVKPQKEMNALTDPVLRIVATRETGAAGQSLAALMTHIRELDADSLGGSLESRVARLPLVGTWFRGAQRFISRYERVGTKIDRALAALETSRSTLGRDVALLDRLYDQNVACIRGLLTYVAAGELKLQELQAEHHSRTEVAAASENRLDVEATADLGNTITRLERRVYDLKLSVQVALQSGPQIRLVQNANQVLVEKIQSSILTTIPLWKSQVIIAIGLFNQQKAIELQRAVTQATNEMLVRNAEMLKQGSAEVARESERGVVELETLRSVNRTLIETIDETLRIAEEGRQKRHEAEAVLEQLQEERRARLAVAQHRAGSISTRPGQEE